MSVQKSWVDLLGTDLKGVIGSGNTISRSVGNGRYVVLWSFPTVADAARNLAQWKSEVTANK